jgi:hypothetical protein
VFASSASGPSSLRTTGDDGGFEISGLPLGEVNLSATGARSRSLTSRPVNVALREGEEPPFVKLRLGLMQKMHIRVMSPQGPVPAARAAVRSGNVMEQISQPVITDVDGIADPDVPDAPRVFITVSPPGYAFRVFDVPVDGRAETLNVPEIGGIVTVRNVPNPSSRRPFVFTQDGRPIEVTELFTWCMAHGQALRNASGVFTFPDMAPADYRICLDDHCAAGTLAPFGSLDLDLSDLTPKP